MKLCKKDIIVLSILVILSIVSTIFIFYNDRFYDKEIITNSKEFMKIIFSAIGCIIVIPITSYITSRNLIKKDE